jgi:hypothetical protein
LGVCAAIRPFLAASIRASLEIVGVHPPEIEPLVR